MSTGMVREQNVEKHIEKQMGCMAGFLQIFDRHQMLTGKRIHSAKRLPPSAPPAEDSSPEPEKYIGTPARSTPSPERVKRSPPGENQSPTPEATQAKMPPPLPGFEFKEGTRSSWKFSREAPRLSLDSRAIVDAKGSLHPRGIRSNPAMLSTYRCENPGDDGAENDGDKQRRSTSVIARLMGLEPLPESDHEPLKKAQLQRSASESRVSRDLAQPQYRFFDSNYFQLKQWQQQQSNYRGKTSGNVVWDNAAASAIDNRLSNGRGADPKGFSVRNGKTEPAKVSLRLRGIGQKKSFYDCEDFFPETKHNISVYGEIERKLKMRGIDEPCKDLETLKQIREALQLKGLLHSKKSVAPINQRNLVYVNASAHESPIVVMKPVRSSVSLNRPVRTGSDSPPSNMWSSHRARRNNETLPTASPRRDRPEIDRNVRTQSQGRARNSRSPTCSESSVKSPNRIKKLMNMEMQSKVNDGIDPRRVSPVHSPKISLGRIAPDQQVSNRSPRIRKAMALTYHKEEKVIDSMEDESSTISECSLSTFSQTDTDRCKVEEYKEGRNLLERCDKLLNIIAEITTATELQPSPVSVLDSSFHKDELSCSPSPVMKRCIDYKDQPTESEDDIWSAVLGSCESRSDEASEDCDFVYVSEILRVSNYLPEDSDTFLLLEKQQYLKGNDTSKASMMRRRLIFDTIHEILNRNRRLPPWKVASWFENTPVLQRIWPEFQRIREREESEDLFEVICGVLRKDLAEDGMNEWGECPIEVGDMVLDIERLIFKDLISETIGDLASFAGKCTRVSAFRRKLVF